MIKIFATTDIHGKFFPYNYKSTTTSNTSICHIKSIIKSLRDKNSIVVDNGDLIHGNFAERFVDRDNPSIISINDIGYDIWNMGNHEFNFGEKILLKNVKEFKNTALIANIEKPIMPGFRIMEIDDKRIAFIGINTIMVNSFGNNSLQTPKILDPVDVLNKIMPEIKSNSDVIIGLFHVGLYDENSVNHTGVESILKDLIVPFDIVIAGHTHEEHESVYIGTTLVTQPGAYANSLSLIELDFEENKLTNKTARIIYSDKYMPDEQLLKKLQPYHDEICKYSKYILGYLENVEGNYDYDLEDGPLIHLFTSIMRSYYPTDVVSFQFDWKKPVLCNGAINRSQLSKIYSYTGGEVSVYEITGAQLKRYINWSYRYLTYKDGAIKISKRRATFKYKTLDIFGNIKYKIDLEKEDMVIELKYLDGRDILDDDLLTIGMNSYRMNYLICDRGPLKNTTVRKITSSTENKLNNKFGTILKIAEQFFDDLNDKTFKYNGDVNFKIIQNSKK